ncbi:MAG: GntR family transcriptional regulator [Ruminococcaceae bacterium]|nr:GntR family transcriptional regulator [Oscillospiraceae bacterium]
MKKPTINLGKFDTKSDMPLYTQLSNIVKRSISAGTLREGEKLPSESELCRIYDVSRSTVRQAIGILESEGMLVRMQGRGTFVTSSDFHKRSYNVYSFTSEISGMGRVPTSTILEFEVIIPPAAVARLLELGEGVYVYRFRRIRNVDGEPVILETSHYPTFIYPGLNRKLLATHSFYSLLYEKGVVPHTAEDEYSATLLKEEEAKLLDSKPGAAAFAVKRLTKTEQGIIYEYTESLIRGDKVHLSVGLSRDGASFKRVI